VVSTSVTPDGSTQLILGLSHSEFTKSFWPYLFQAEISILVGKSLEVSLQCTNTGSETFTCSDALHTYFNIRNISDIKIKGLHGFEYFNGFEQIASGKQTDNDLEICQEENRRYINHSTDCIIKDSGFNRNIHVSKKGSNVTVVWNPWENAKSIPDIPDDGYKTMICVETANAYSDKITVDPGKSFRVTTKIYVEP